MVEACPSKRGRPLEVYGWTALVRCRGRNTRCRLIVAAPSFASACRDAEAVGLRKLTRGYYSTSTNPSELEAALDAPGTVLACERYLAPESRYVPVVGGRAS